MLFIFEVRMKPGYTVEEYAEAWIRASEIIQRTPGALGTYLHRKIGEPDVLLAIAHWQSKAHRDAKDDRRNAIVRAILDKHASTCEIKVVGEFDEPEWSVLPTSNDNASFAIEETAMNEHVYKTIELTGSSTTGIEDAVNSAVAKASETMRNIHWFEVVETRGYIENGAVAYWQVTIKLGFTLE